jgi:hypothetical protein
LKGIKGACGDWGCTLLDRGFESAETAEIKIVVVCGEE